MSKLLKFHIWECPAFQWKNQLTEIATESSFTAVVILIVILMKKVKLVVPEKLQLDNRDESFSKIFFWKFWTKIILKQGSTPKSLQ